MASPATPEDTGPPHDPSATDDGPDEVYRELAEEAVEAMAEDLESSGEDDEFSIQEATARALRAQAELENFRRRSRKEMEDVRRYATLPLLEDLLGVVDNLKRALDAAEHNADAAGLREGVQMVAQQFDSVLRAHHCQQIEAEGTMFDPNRHEAIGQQPTAEHPPGTVVLVARDGYLLHDRVIRPAQVMVAAEPPSEEE